MVKYLIAILLAIFSALGFIYFYVGVPRVYQEGFLEIKTPHLYRESSVPIAEIQAKVFYFLPKNKQDFLLDNWQAVFQSHFERLKAFHNMQFQALSRFEYEIYPVPVIGSEDNQFYDTDITNYGNPEALKSISGEIEKRVFSPRGDLYLADFSKPKKGAFQVFYIIYEGVGASGSANTALISRDFLTDVQYKVSGGSILAHEFYHTLGIPDGYQIPSAVIFTSDIMGEGRSRSLEKTYLDRATLKKMGL